MIRIILLLALVGGCSRSTPAKPPAVEPATPLTHVDGAHGKLHVDDGGRGGQPIIFIHGLGGDLHLWKDTLAHVRT